MSEKAFTINQDAVRQLSELLVESDLTEIEYQHHETRIRIVKNPTPTLVQRQIDPHPTSNVETTSPSSSISEQGVPLNQGHEVVSPMVGTAYVAPEPGAPPFVKVGDRVSEGQTLLIVEAMKVMNPIKSSATGTVSKICVQDATPVEFGEPLLYIATES